MEAVEIVPPKTRALNTLSENRSFRSELPPGRSKHGIDPSLEVMGE